jgi:hypothetical protein
MSSHNKKIQTIQIKLNPLSMTTYSHFSFFFIVLGRGNCGSYNISTVSYLNSPRPPFSYILPLPTPIPGIVSKGIIFPFTYIYTQYLYHIHPLTPFPHFSPFSVVPTPQDKTCSTIQFPFFFIEITYQFDVNISIFFDAFSKIYVAVKMHKIV